MIFHFLSHFFCRITGRPCSTNHPSSKDLISEMKDRKMQVEAQTVEIRRKRRSIEEGWRGSSRDE